jgi:hypothetical protein
MGMKLYYLGRLTLDELRADDYKNLMLDYLDNLFLSTKSFGKY